MPLPTTPWLDMAEVARQANQPDDAQMYSARAEKLRSVYFQTFYDPQTGVLAGWKSADGNLHDYYFTFVNGMAITYGLVPPDKANLIMDRLLAKMKEVGYTHFEYGLPGNLIPVRRGDYVGPREALRAEPTKEDGSDGFQIYENGGATACYGLLHAASPLPVWAGARTPTRCCFPCSRRLRRAASRALARTA